MKPGHRDPDWQPELCPNCGKRVYHPKNAARQAHGRNGKRIRVYVCPGTSHWHTTAQDKNDGNRRLRTKLNELLETDR